MTLTHIFLVGLGGAFGAIGRYVVVTAVASIVGQHIHWATFTVNVIGSFLLGLAFVMIVENMAADNSLRPLLMVGFLGAFTTFSTFSLEVFALFERGHYLDAGAYILLSVILCVLATASAVLLGRLILTE